MTTREEARGAARSLERVSARVRALADLCGSLQASCVELQGQVNARGKELRARWQELIPAEKNLRVVREGMEAALQLAKTNINGAKWALGSQVDLTDTEAIGERLAEKRTSLQSKKESLVMQREQLKEKRSRYKQALKRCRDERESKDASATQDGQGGAGLKFDDQLKADQEELGNARKLARALGAQEPTASPSLAQMEHAVLNYKYVFDSSRSPFAKEDMKSKRINPVFIPPEFAIFESKIATQRTEFKTMTVQFNQRSSQRGVIWTASLYSGKGRDQIEQNFAEVSPQHLVFLERMLETIPGIHIRKE